MKLDTETAPISIEAASSEGNFGKALAIFIAKEKQPALLGSKESQTADNNKEADSAEKKEEKKDGDKTTAVACKATEEGKCDKDKCTWDKEKSE